MKAELVSHIMEVIKRRKLSQQEAAKRIGMTQPKLSRLFNGHFHGISETKLVECITKLGSDVEIAA